MKKTLPIAIAIALLAPMNINAMAKTNKAHEKHHASSNENILVTTTKLSDNIYMLQAKGGNIGLFIGEKHIFIIDNDYTNATPAILKAVKGISSKEIKFILNTHWHGDHTGGNEILGKSGSTIIAHENVRKRLSVDNYIKAFNMKSSAAPKIALPTITYNNEMTLDFDNGRAQIIHVKNAHTDGDSIIIFEDENIIHAGDIFFNGFYPFIDANTGGSIKGLIKAVDLILSKSDSKTRIIPGHGPISNQTELKEYRDMLASVYGLIKPMKDAEKTLGEIVKLNPLKDFDAKWGGGFLNYEQWIGIAYDAVK